MKIIDLSTPIYSGMDVYPGDPEVDITVKHTYEKEGWQLSQLTMGSHTGTHVDAYSHMHSGKASIDQIPLDRFFGKAQVVEKFADWPQEIGLFFTEEVGLSSLERILKSQPNFVGGTISEALERALLEAEIITYTDLVNLDQLPVGEDFTFYGLPLNIKCGDGSPVRAMAILDESFRKDGSCVL